MSSTMNHRKRSHRSQRMHYQAAGILRRQIAATHFERTPLLAGLRRPWMGRQKGRGRAGDPSTALRSAQDDRGARAEAVRAAEGAAE